jgi:hypothetical protein
LVGSNSVKMVVPKSPLETSSTGKTISPSIDTLHKR